MAEEKKETKQRRSSAKKRDIQSLKRQLHNKSFKSQVNSAIRSFQSSLSSGDKTKIQDDLKTVFSLMDKGVKTNIFKQNKAARIKSRLHQKTQV
jgi:small subunit ribosomal protein S20